MIALFLVFLAQAQVPPSSRFVPEPTPYLPLATLQAPPALASRACIARPSDAHTRSTLATAPDQNADLGELVLRVRGGHLDLATVSAGIAPGSCIVRTVAGKQSTSTEH